MISAVYRAPYSPSSTAAFVRSRSASLLTQRVLLTVPGSTPAEASTPDQQRFFSISSEGAKGTPFLPLSRRELMTVDNAQQQVAAKEQTIAAPGARWLSAPGAFRLDDAVETQTGALQWIPPRSRISVAGIFIPGGVYVGTCQYYPFTFVIDPTLPVGRPERAEPIVPSGYPTGYWLLTENQRAFFLHWLRGDTQRLQHVDSSPYLRRFLSGLEWRLCVQRDTDDTFLDGCELLAFRDGRQFQYHALELLSWWGQFQNPRAQRIVVEETINLGFTEFPQSVLALAAANIAASQELIPISVAVEIALSHPRKSVRCVTNLRERLRQRLLAMYPQGIPLPTTSKQVEISYSPVCPELRNERLVRQGSPIPRLKIPDVLSEIGQILDPVVSSILSGPHFDPAVAAEIASQVRSTQAFLEQEFPPAPEDKCIIPPAPRPASQTLTATEKAAVGTLLTRSIWTNADFTRLAQEFRLMPSGLRIRVNRWVQGHCGDLLLEGTEPIQLNPYVREEIKCYL